MAEQVILEAKLNNGETKEDKDFKNIKKSVAADIGSQRAAADIAKSLVMDFLVLINIAVAKAVFDTFTNKKEFMDGLVNMWNERTSMNLSAETKMFQDAIFNAINSEKNVSPEMSKKVEEQLNKYCNTRDAAVSLAKESVQNIIDTILDTPQNTTTENKEEEQKR